MPHKKQDQLTSRGAKTPCPVCGEISYSAGGVHPQCSVKLADEKRMERARLENEAAPKVKPENTVKPWQKTCPKCSAVQHVRKKVCECGHTFSSGARPPSNDIDI